MTLSVTMNPHRPPWLERLQDRDKATLLHIDQDCPDSIGLLDRIIQPLLQEPMTGISEGVSIRLIIEEGIRAYRVAMLGGEDEPERFGCFIDAVTQALPRTQQARVARALSAYQRAALARRLPSSQAVPSIADAGDAR